MGFFSVSNDKLEVLKMTQENLETTQKNLDLMLQTKPESPPLPTISEEEKKKAAYALNLCTVSISQIIDYDDIYVLEQEYDAILNNLNLEEMPKDNDDALLNLLKQLLNTITFFRIQEGDKVFIEREYQQRIKDAIWSALPNFGMIPITGDPLAIGVSLVAQIGTGYMNYRKEKAKVNLEYEKQQWQLQRSAIEQFNGLRRELFDTAWRLADQYKIPDKYRITERQISRYNEILLDPNYLRRYERLAFIAEDFNAYPPYLYFLGNAANMVSQDDRYDIETRSEYRAHALKHFSDYLGQPEHNILRENQLLSACALEYFDLLIATGNKDQTYLAALIKRAIEASSSLDIMELAAFAYGKIGMLPEAIRLYRMLVNEDYNTAVNAQILTYLYARQYLQDGDTHTLRARQSLSTRLDDNFLFPIALPSREQITLPALNSSFLAAQRGKVTCIYHEVLEALLEIHTVQFNRALLCLDEEKVKNPEWYFSDVPYARQVRSEDLRNMFANSKKAAAYIHNLAESNFEKNMLDALSDLYHAIADFPFIRNSERKKKEFFNAIENQISNYNPEFDTLLSKITKYPSSADKNDCFTLVDLDKLLAINVNFFISDAVEILLTVINEEISFLDDMSKIAQAKTALYQYCIKHGIPVPAVDDITLKETVIEPPKERSFDLSLLGKAAEAKKRKVQMAAKLVDIISTVSDRILVPGATNIEFYLRGEDGFERYLERHDGLNREDTIAIINDTSINDVDWVLTTEGIFRYKSLILGALKVGHTPVPYREVKQTSDRQLSLVIGKHICDDNKRINLNCLKSLCQELAEAIAKRWD